jgi:hypothetical protein
VRATGQLHVTGRELPSAHFKALERVLTATVLLVSCRTLWVLQDRRALRAVLSDCMLITFHATSKDHCLHDFGGGDSDPCKVNTHVGVCA